MSNLKRARSPWHSPLQNKALEKPFSILAQKAEVLRDPPSIKSPDAKRNLFPAPTSPPRAAMGDVAEKRRKILAHRRAADETFFHTLVEHLSDKLTQEGRIYIDSSLFYVIDAEELVRERFKEPIFSVLVGASGYISVITNDGVLEATEDEEEERTAESETKLNK